MLIAALAFHTATAAAPDGNVTFRARQVSVADAIAAIEQQTEYLFSFDPELVDVQRLVTMPGQTVTVAEAVQTIVGGERLTYTFINNYIAISPKPASPSTEPRTQDTYRKTRADSLSAASIRRPSSDPENPSAVYPTIDQPVDRAGLSDFYSSYTAPDRFAYLQEHLPRVAAKINVLYAAAALTPNLALEVGLGGKTSLELMGSYNPWRRIGTLEKNDKLVHWIVRPEFRYWFCERYNGHFLGVHAFFSKYNISGKKIPIVGFRKENRYEGNAWGAGINYGYSLPLARRWNLEFALGVGVARLRYERFNCALCSSVIETRTKTYFGPTNASVGVVFIIK